MKSPSIDYTVYKCMFPNPKPTDPQNFQSLLQRSLVPEVRLETQAFYGHLSSQEAKYPGLDYSHKPHRLRLSRYPWHRRLFRAFDNLGLTKDEIAGLTKWEGTRWAKERFEREQGIVIRDSTADEIGVWVEHDARSAVARTAHVAGEDDMGYPVEEKNGEEEEEIPEAENDSENQVEIEYEAESDAEMSSVGIELNERLRAAVAQREAGDSNVTMDEAWEKWFLERLASGETPSFYDIQPTLSPNAHIPGTRPETLTHDERARFARWLSAGRAGQWHTIPSMVHSIVRGELENEARRERASPASSLASSNTSSPSPLTTTGHLPSVHEMAAFEMELLRNAVPPSSRVADMPANVVGSQYGTRHSLMASAPPPFRGSLTRHRRTLFERGDAAGFGQSR